jgi:hypothetical protein
MTCFGLCNEWTRYGIGRILKMGRLFVDIYRPLLVRQRHEWLHPLDTIHTINDTIFLLFTYAVCGGY